MVEPGKKPVRGHAGDRRRQRKRPGEIGRERQHRKAGMIAGELRRLLLQHLAGNVDRHIGGDRGRGREQQADLAARARPELDERTAGGQEACELASARAQDLELAAGRVIFRERGDLLEQPRAGIVVEILRRKALLPRGEPGEHVAQERRVGGCGLDPTGRTGRRGHRAAPRRHRRNRGRCAVLMRRNPAAAGR